MTTKEMREQRAALVAEARKLNDVAEAEKRSLTAEETERWDKLFAEVDLLKEQIDAGEAEQRRGDWLKAQEDALAKPANEPSYRATPGRSTTETTVAKAVRDKWGHFDNVAPEYRPGLEARAKPEYDAAFREYLSTGREVRGLIAGIDTEGGYLAPMSFLAQLIKAVDNQVFMRQVASVFSVANSASLGCPVLVTEADDAAWTSEVVTAAEDTAIRFGLREWRPHPLAKLIRVSRKLMRVSVPSAEGVVIQQLSYKLAVAQENGFLNGTGVGEPLGIFVEHASGIPSSRTKDTATADAIVGDDLLSVLYMLKGQYQANATWILHRDVALALRKIKVVADGEYAWQPGLQSGSPDVLLGRPVMQSEYAPKDLTTDNVPLLAVGDMRYYWIADALNLEIQNLVELYAATNQVGFIARSETDGMPVLGEAFAILTNKAV